ncbi:hypothetical protein L3C95_10855 [Chitinophaga filiformis]|uniref:hypothetical protein n=1 Tax=Chitinophaga filiformis TaxID=104663 RepID=UPI001F2A53B9|nr:hypothetical protein [Chitinophaga filiformis]MCF6402705.1 hypothetical protein [Chitinophaga filiformis]MCF6403377.1 hypothetical protein [Chitinophaga filiformis]
MKILHIICISLLCAATTACAQTQANKVAVQDAVWMPKAYLDARKVHPPQDTFWKTVDFAKYLSPVSALRITNSSGQQQVSVYTYGAENFPIAVTGTKHAGTRKEWLLDKPIFTGGQSAIYDNVHFSLISHNNDRTDLWVGLIYEDGKKDSIQLAPVPKQDGNAPLWMHANNYLAYYFKGKQFDIYDDKGTLLYDNVKTDTNGAIEGLPGYKSWSITSNNIFQIISDNQADPGISSFNVAFKGENISLQPEQATGTLNKPLVLKEKTKY